MCTPPQSADGNFSYLTPSNFFLEENFSHSSGGDLQSDSKEEYSNGSGSDLESDIVLCNVNNNDNNDPIWPDDQLIEYIRNGDINFLEFWFRQEFHFNPKMQQEALCVCGETGNREVLNFFLENKHISSNPFLGFSSDEKKHKLWGYIAERHDKEMAELLLNFCLSPLLINGTNIALQCALQAKDLDILILLKKFGFFDLKGISSHVLRELAKDENIKLLEQLIGKDFDLNRTYPEREWPKIPLMLAMNYLIFDEVRSLSLFQLALISTNGPQKQVIKLLLDNGVKPNQWINGESAISFAVTLQDIELIKILLFKGADSDIYIKGEKGDTAMSKARLSKNQEIIDLLEYCK